MRSKRGANGILKLVSTNFTSIPQQQNIFLIEKEKEKEANQGTKIRSRNVTTSTNKIYN